MSAVDRLDEIQPTWYRGMYGCQQDMYAATTVKPLVAALRAVLDMHKPEMVATSASSISGYVATIVTRCSCQPVWLGYPCPTVAAITAALDGDF